MQESPTAPAKVPGLPVTEAENPSVGSGKDFRGNWASPVGDANRMPMTSETRSGNRNLCVFDAELFGLMEKQILLSQAILLQLYRLNGSSEPGDMGELLISKESVL